MANEPDSKPLQGAADPFRCYGILTGEEIRALKIVCCEKQEDRCFKPASYDLRLGEEYMLPSPGKSTLWGNHAVVLFCSDKDPLRIPPFSSVLVSTHERVELPKNVTGRFNLRVKMAFKGLVVQMGTQVEPGYTGRLFAILQNITENAVVINHADYETRLFTIEFSYTSKDAVVEGTDKKSYDHVRDIMGNARLPSAIDSIVRNVEQHDKALRRQKKMFSTWGPTIATLLFTFAVTASTLLISTISPIIFSSATKAISLETSEIVSSVFDGKLDGLTKKDSEIRDDLEKAKQASAYRQEGFAETLRMTQAQLVSLQGRINELEAALRLQDNTITEGEPR